MANKYDVISPTQTLFSKEKLDTKVYFNNTLGENISLDPILDVIKNAKHSIEIAMFSFDSLKLKEALYEALKKGINITLILDASRAEKHNLIFYDLPSSIKRIDLGNFSETVSTDTTYMHHKLLIADRDFETEKLITGSMDYTSKGEKYEQGFFIITGDKTITEVYKKEMDFLKRGIAGKNKFEKEEYNPWAAHIEYPDNYVDIWFSPGFNKNSVKYKIVEEILNAQKNINIIMWQFTDRTIANALIKKAREGVKIKIISEDLVADDINSQLSYMKNILTKEGLSNIEFILDTKSNELVDLSKLRPGFSPFIHHHFMLVDDTTIILGTNNWSTWGFYKNDEDTIVTNNQYIIREFQKTFDYFYKTLK